MGMSNFETLTVALGGVLPVGEAYDGLWTADPGVAVRAATEFYGGTVHLALHIFPNTAEQPDLPDFLALRGMAGWGLPLRLPAGVRLTPGAAVGGIRWEFDEGEPFGTGPLEETELAAGLFARLEVPVVGRVRAVAEAEWLRVYTATPLDFMLVQAGLSFSAETPGWLRRLLR